MSVHQPLEMASLNVPAGRGLAVVGGAVAGPLLAIGLLQGPVGWCFVLVGSLLVVRRLREGRLVGWFVASAVVSTVVLASALFAALVYALANWKG